MRRMLPSYTYSLPYSRPHTHTRRFRFTRHVSCLMPHASRLTPHPLTPHLLTRCVVVAVRAAVASAYHYHYHYHSTTTITTATTTL